MTQTSFCLGTICNVAHTKNLWHSTEINAFVHSSCFFMMKLQWQKGTKRNADEKKFMMIFFLKAFRLRAKKAGGTSLSLQFPILIPFRQWLIDYFFTLP